jgi:hypothetical protein
LVFGQREMLTLSAFRFAISASVATIGGQKRAKGRLLVEFLCTVHEKKDNLSVLRVGDLKVYNGSLKVHCCMFLTRLIY